MTLRRRNTMPVVHRITPCLWFDNQAEEAVAFYTAIFKNSKVVTVSRYGEAGKEIHGRPAGSVMTIAFELDGQTFTALNGGPVFKFNEAISLQVNCETQAEVDHFWTKLSEGGDPSAQQCGWPPSGRGWSACPGPRWAWSRSPSGGVGPRAPDLPAYCTTSSARSSSEGGMVNPSVAAVLRLTARTYVVGCCAGRSDGLAPLRMRST